MLIPQYPDSVPVSLDIKPEMHPQLSLTPDGVSEFTFSNLFLFRRRYLYSISRGPDNTFIIQGERDGKKFFSTPCASPPDDILKSLLAKNDYWKNIPESILESSGDKLKAMGLEITEDRDNFDYLYLRTELAELSGKRFHKKKNLVNAFNNAYPNHEIKPITKENIPDAFEVLDRWKEEKGGDGDFIAAHEALELFGVINLKGSMFYVDGKPAGWCLGESIAKGRMFAVHFEKGLDEIKGLYQYMNQAFAASLPRFFTYINREQDLGDLGLRQAKETYRPVGYVKKCMGRIDGSR
jgi:hypothetical protein